MSYAASGVSIHEGDRFAALIQQHMRRTHGPRVIANEGGFAGLFRLDYNETLFKRNYRDPVLVACCDGVGTKIKLALAADAGRAAADAGLDPLEAVGVDLVAMSVNDLVVQGAEPLLFLDYIAAHRVVPEQLERIVKGIASACRACGAALLGGETAEMPGVYPEGEIDLAGFAVGVLELDRAIDPERVEPGDVVLGLASDGLHSNGFSLVRRIVDAAALDLTAPHPDVDAARPLGEVLLAPTRLYAPPIVRLLRNYKVKKIVSGMAHVTGGGLAANLARALHEGVDARVRRDAWTVPPIFELLRAAGCVDPEEMDAVFNLGIGYCLVVRPAFAASVRRQLERSGEGVVELGEIVPGSGSVTLT